MKNLFLSFTLVLLSVSAFAQDEYNTKTATSIVNVKIPQALNLEVTSGSIIDFDFSSDLALLGTGIEKLNAVVLTYSSNKPWFLSINATTDNFTGGDAADPLPSSAIQFKNNAGGNYAPLTMTSVSLSGTTAAKNMDKGPKTIGVDYKLTPGYEYPAASDYSIGVTYTISTI